MDSKSRIVILCESYPSIAYTLYRITNEKSGVSVSIYITALKDMYRLFQIINEKVFNNDLELIYYPRYEANWVKTKGIKRLFNIFGGILGERRYIKQFYHRHFAGLENTEILFSSPGYSGAKIYVLNRLSKKNKIIYIDPGPPYMVRYSPRSLRDIATLLFYKMVYGKDTQLGQYPPQNPWSTGLPLMTESFMKNSVDSVIDWSNREQIMEDFAWEKYRVFDTGNYKVMYFHQDLVGGYVPDRDTFKQELNSVFDIIRRYYPEREIARKYHPDHELNKDVIEIGQELPAYIPAELLYNEKVQIYLGISSNAIVSVRCGQAISLIDLISFKSDKVKEGQKERLIRASRSEILFPSSLEELERMIIDISGRKL